MQIIKQEKFDVEKIVQELYDFKKLGGLSIPDFLEEDYRKDLLKQLNENKDKFSEIKREKETTDKKGVIQEMKTFSSILDKNLLF